MKTKNFFKKVLTAVLLVTLISTLCVPSFALGFADVLSDNWAWDSINKVSSMGLMVGRGTPNGIRFDPNGYVLGLEICETLYRIADGKYSEEHFSGTVRNPIYFDMETAEWIEIKDQWYSASSEWALRSGIVYAEWTESASSEVPGAFVVSGRYGSMTAPLECRSATGEVPGSVEYSQTNNACATRSDVVLMLYYYATTYLGADATERGDLSCFTDLDISEDESLIYDYTACIPYEVKDEFITAWEWAVGSGIIKGCGDGTLQPGKYIRVSEDRRYVTRAEYAVILDRFTSYLENIT